MGNSRSSDTSEFRRVHTVESDLGKLNRLLAGMIGERCWHVGFYDGQPFQLQIGEKVTELPEPPRSGAEGFCADLVLGSWGIALWDVGVIGFDFDEETGRPFGIPLRSRETSDMSLFECNVERVIVHWPSLDLEIRFETGVGLLAIPSDGGRDYWDVFLPDETMIKAQRGPSWIHKSSFSSDEDETRPITKTSNRAIRSAAIEAGLNEWGTFVVGVRVIGGVESRE